MPQPVSVSGSFDKDYADYNGLDGKFAEELLASRGTRYVVVGIIEGISSKDDWRTGEVTPTVRPVHLEVVRGDEAVVVRQILDRIWRERMDTVADPQRTLMEANEDEETWHHRDGNLPYPNGSAQPDQAGS